MTAFNHKELFDAVRTVKGKALTPADVEIINRAIGVATTLTITRQPSQAGIDLIHSFEALRLTAYPDPGSSNGLPITNGWGTTVDENGGAIPRGAVWTREKADRLFARDLTRFASSVDALLGAAPTTQAQFDALVSFAYNVGAGEGGLKTSTLLRMHKAGDYAGAKAQFARWVNNDGKRMNGLVRRRAAEAALYGGAA